MLRPSGPRLKEPSHLRRQFFNVLERGRGLRFRRRKARLFKMALKASLHGVKESPRVRDCNGATNGPGSGKGPAGLLSKG